MGASALALSRCRPLVAMLRFVCLAVLGALVYSQSSMAPSGPLNPDCCMPEMVSYTVHTENATAYANGVFVREQTFLKGNFDYKRNIIAFKGLNYVQQDSGNFTIERYWVITTPNASLFIDEADQICVPIQNHIWFPRFCIPGDAEHLGSSNYGPPGKTFAAVDEMCTPVQLVQNRNGPGWNMVLSSAISNLGFTLDDVALTPPAFCNATIQTLMQLGQQQG